ncbi:MAG TPA: hypothetical protein VGE46_01825, partial [Bdellovibrio sp.]
FASRPKAINNITANLLIVSSSIVKRKYIILFINRLLFFIPHRNHQIGAVTRFGILRGRPPPKDRILFYANFKANRLRSFRFSIFQSADNEGK